MTLKTFRSFTAAFLLFVLLGEIVFPLKISEDTLKAISRNKFYPTGCAFYENKLPSDFPNLSLANPQGAISLAKLEYEMYVAISKKMSCKRPAGDEDFTQALEEYVEDYRATASSLMQSGMSLEDSVKSIAGNIIAVYRTVRRFRNYIQPWILEQKKGTAFPFQIEVLEAINASGEFLELFANDFHLSMIPIITTQFVLDWKAEDICRGALQGMELGSSLKALHCLEIGAHAIASGMYPIGIEWIEQAVSKATHENETSLDVQFAKDVLVKAYAKHDKRWRPLNLVNFEETFYEIRLNESVKVPHRKLARKWRKEAVNTEKLGVKLEAQEIERFSKICQGKIKQPEHIRSKLFCWLETSVHPTWRIGPLKAELISGFPHDMVLFYDVISESLTEDLIEYYEPLNTPGKLYATGLNPKTRLSSSSAIRHPTLERRLDGMTERITGLRTKETNVNHVSSYPAGGHMNLHLDLKNIEGQDDYIATVIYYFKAAQIGGETGFTGAQVNLKAPTGSAIFWYHMFKSGVRRKGGAHGSCPLIQGQKWVGVKWLEYTKQTHLVCDTGEHSRMEYLVNGRSKYKRGRQTQRRGHN